MLESEYIKTLEKLAELDAQKDRLILDLMSACHWALNIEGMVMFDDGSWNAQAHFDHVRAMLKKAIEAGYEVE